ncbi:MAG: glycosyltransferase family 4 protein [Rhodothermales bacterium]
MRVAVFYQYYHTPDCAADSRHYTFIRHLAQRHQVTLLTTSAWQHRRLSERYPWVPDGVTLHTFDIPYDNTMPERRRVRAFGQYAGNALFRGLRMPRPDVIFGSSTPLTAAWAAHRVAAWRGVPWVFEVRDLWPDFPVQMGAVRHPILKKQLYRLEKRLYASAAHIVALSPDMETHIRGLGIPGEKITTLIHGTDFDLIDQVEDDQRDRLAHQYGLLGRNVVLYAGRYGRANDIPTLLQAAHRLSHRDDIRFIITGDGYFAPAVRDAAERLPGVTCLPPQPRHEVFSWFKLAHVTLVPFLDLPVLSANSPAKFFDSLGAGTPVIVTNPGWTRRFVEEHRCGWYVPPSNPEALAQRLERVLADPAGLKAAGLRGSDVARRHFDRAVLAGRLEDILVTVAS